MIVALLSTPAAHAQQPDPEAEEVAEGLEEIVVQTTRSGRRVQDDPIRVEVITQEEIEEKVLMRPGNISMLLAETGGLRVQTTAPGLGAANIRVQGLSGRYTQLLTDGLPLYGGQASSLGLLQIPPADLGQVEVIKGAASALYGPSALGGIINLIARRPGPRPEFETVLNATSRGGQDATGYAAGPMTEALSYSAVAGVHRQDVQDLDGDGWADMPGYDRWAARPRLFWSSAGGASAFFTLGAMSEQRAGGMLRGRAAPDGTPYPQAQKTARWDGGVVAEVPTGDRGTLHFRASAMTQDHAHQFGPIIEDDRHDTLFAEASFAARGGGTSWLGGVAVQRDLYRARDYELFNYEHTVPGLFVQVEHDLRADLSIAASGRWDVHDAYGDHVSPRLSMLYRPRPFTIRASLGKGFYAPTPFVEEVDDVGLSRLAPPSGLAAETATTASLEAGYAHEEIEANVIFFASDIADAVRLVEPGAGAALARLTNLPGKVRTRGAEALVRYRRDGFTVTGSYVFVDATEPELGGGSRRAVALTPRHTAGMVAMWEEHDAGRVGLEVYYTGRQRLEDNPFRAQGRAYVEVGVLGEVALGKARLFINLENLLGVRQTKYDPLLRPRRGGDGAWTVDSWAPLEGFVVNGGVRIRFGEE